MGWRSGKPSTARSIRIEADDPGTMVAADSIRVAAIPS